MSGSESIGAPARSDAGGSGSVSSGANPVLESRLPLPLLHRGKVREMYEAGPSLLLMVASDRVSAFDVVLPDPIPRKGEVLTQLTAWWLHRLDDLVRHHLISADPDEIAERVPALADCRDDWAGRSLLVRRTRPFPVECVVRGYLAGSAWAEYKVEGTLAGEPLPPGLRESEALPMPIYSPATKAVQGHDENITFGHTETLIGRARAEALRELSLKIYEFGRETAAARDILLADTKFEFGETDTGELILIDEVLTPDSSRYWPADAWAPGTTPTSLDKQPIRDWLAALPDWDRRIPAPKLAPEVVAATTGRYLEIFRRLTGSELGDWNAPASQDLPRMP